MNLGFVLMLQMGANECGVGEVNDSLTTVRQRNRWGGPSIMVWAGISSRHRTLFVVVNETLTAQPYIDQILRQ